jgi:polar amino acid transport system substrate-binding protein
MKSRKLSLFLLITLALVLALVACQSAPAEPTEAPSTEEEQPAPAPEEEEQAESTLERARREGVIRVGFANENPYAFAQPDGTLSGEAVEVARAVFQQLGIDEMEGVLTQFGSLIPGLQAGRFDVITAGMYITPTRCEEVLFADPEYQVGEALIVEAGNPLGLNSYEDIAANPDARVGTGSGYLEIDYMLAAGVTEDQITTFPDDPSGVAGLQAGQIDAWTGTRPTLLITMGTTNDPNLELADPFQQPVVDGEPVISYGGAAFRYDDLDFREAFNEELQAIKDSGQLLELIGQFEGFDEGSLPGATTAEDICPDAYSSLQ